MSQTPPQANSAVLRVKAGPLARPLLTRVVAMMLARAQCPVDRLDDAMVICDALAAHACAHAEDDTVEFTVVTRLDTMELRVGALLPGGADRLARATALPGIGSVLEPIADEVRVEPSERLGGHDELVLSLSFNGNPVDVQAPASTAALQGAEQAGAGDQAPAD